MKIESLTKVGIPSLEPGRNVDLFMLNQAETGELFQSMSATDPEVQRPWEFYAAAFAKQLTGSDDWGSLHLSVTPSYLNWNHPDYGVAYLMKFADQIPSWQGRYVPDVRRFYEAYRYIVTSYAIEYAADPLLQAKAREKAFILEIALQDYNDGWQDVGVRWRTFDAMQRSAFPPNRWKSFDEWYAQNGARTMQVLQNRITIASAEYQSVMNGIGISTALLAEAISKVSNDAYFVRAKAADGTTLPYPSYTISNDFTDFLDGTKENLRKNPDHVAWGFSFNYASGYRSESHTRWGADGIFSLGGGFAVNVGGSWEERRIDTQSKNFAVEVTFGGFQEFAFQPAAWYSAAVIQTIKNGPWVNNSVVDRWIKQGRAVWGKNGLLSLQQHAAIIGIQPRIKVSLATHEYHYYRQAYSANAGVSFFGFRLGGGGGGSERVEISWTDNTGTFEIVDKSGLALLVGIRSVEMPV